MKSHTSHTRQHVTLILALLCLVGAAIVVPSSAAFAATNSAASWSTPVNLSAFINSSANDQQPAISPDGLSLYFTSNRAGGLGGFDMYVSHRVTIDAVWGSPVNLGSALNTTADEGNATFSRDGRIVFFQSKRPGGLGGIDIWRSQRDDPSDDFNWQPAVNLGATINSIADDNGPGYFEDAVRGNRQLYFGSSRSGGPGGTDIYVSKQMADGSFGTAALVTELNSSMNESDPSIRNDGLEILFHSNRTGTQGPNDLWVAMRASSLDAWSSPVNVGEPINSAASEQNAYLSADGLTLYFASDQPGGFGSTDLYVSSRPNFPCSLTELYGSSPWSGALTVINQADGTGIIIGTPDSAVGLTGIAFDSRGRLFASTREGTSKLIQINPNNGELVLTIGPINVGGTAIGIGDLSFQPTTGVLYGIRSNSDGAQAGGLLYTINVTTGVATYVGDTGAGASGGIAFAPNGTLYQVAHNSHFDYPSLNTIDPSDAHRIRTVSLSNYYDGLAVRPSDGILFATLGGSDTVYTINPDTGAESIVGSTGQGVSDLDFRTLCDSVTSRIDDPPFFVRQHYRDFLSRAADPGGFAFWTNEITSCGLDQQCFEVKRINVSAAFFLSIEFQQTGYLVYRAYKAAYGNLLNAPVPIKLNDFLPDTQEVGQGVIVNQPGWEQLLENNKQVFFAEFVQRSRFTSTYPTSLTPATFVDMLFANAGVVPSAIDRQAAISEFGSTSNTVDVVARARALRRISENPTLAQQEFNRAFVLMQYFGYLRRNPNDPPEPGLNFDGYNFWLNKLNQFNGNFVQAEMVKAFLVSSEYRQRFGQP